MHFFTILFCLILIYTFDVSLEVKMKTVVINNLYKNRTKSVHNSEVAGHVWVELQ